MLCLVMRLYPTFSPPGLLCFLHLPDCELKNVPAAARHSFNLGTTSSGTREIWKMEENNDTAF